MCWQVASCILLITSAHASCNSNVCGKGEDGNVLLQTRASVSVQGPYQEEDPLQSKALFQTKASVVVENDLLEEEGNNEEEEDEEEEGAEEQGEEEDEEKEKGEDDEDEKGVDGMKKGIMMREMKMITAPTQVGFSEDDLEFGWFNRDPEYLNEGEVDEWGIEKDPLLDEEGEDDEEGEEEDEEAKELVEEDAEGSRRRRQSGGCTARINRLKSIIDVTKAPKTFAYGRDPNFPAAGSSIATRGANCGDSARGIFKSCNKYNTWAKMEDVSKKSYRSAFTVFNAKTGQPAPIDVQQGELGTCYFLAALISVASTHPEIIKGMFVRQNLYSKKVITTKWLVNGRETMIQVDTSIPTNRRRRRPWFTQPTDATKAWWPAILEKTWAKIYTSFKASEYGFWSNAVSAMTRAPTMTYNHRSMSKKQKTELWNNLVQATANKWPIGAGTSKSRYGLAAGHAYSVFGVYNMRRYGNVVKCMNPWGTHRYRGSIPNSKKEFGVFFMTFEEYFWAFHSTGIAKVHSGYHVAVTELTSAKSLEGSYKFTVTQGKPFYVMVVWPGKRMMKPCTALDPQYSVLVKKVGSNRQIGAVKRNSWIGANQAFVEVNSGNGGGIGSYDVAVSIRFPSKNSFTSAYMNIYAAQPVDLYYGSTPYAKLALGMVAANVGGNPCSTISVGSKVWRVFYKPWTYAGLPTYWSLDNSRFLFYYGQTATWYETKKELWSSIQAGSRKWWGTYSKTDMVCGCKDSRKGVPGFSRRIPCSRVKSNYIFTNVRCDKNVQYTATVMGACPVTCGVRACKVARPKPLPQSPAPAPKSAGVLSKCGANAGNYCYGYKSDGSWCWLTHDGKRKYVKQGDGGYKCSSYNGYPSSRYCAS